MTPEPISPSFPSFQSTVPHYVAGRPNYAPALIQVVADHLRLTKNHRLMDLGCGPGWLGIAFAPLVGSVLGIDPEPAMLEAARAIANAAAIEIELVEGSSFDLSPQLGRFRAVTIGRAFHWMDRADTLLKLDPLIEEDGAVMLFNDVRPDVPQNAWYKRYSAVVDRFTNRSVGFAPELLRHETILLESRFSQLTRIGVIEQRLVPVARLIDRALSMSTSSPEQLGALSGQLAQELTTEMSPFATAGGVVEVIESQVLIAQRR
ncbi:MULTISPECIES: class I SAM-dependent methyltransferase [Bradyrhizobium]|uniref:class I SAM-dependent methyltransferase n=1 Tax=Bradyrhizobium TaxID=374 RepID=UPI001554EC14|nr:MULTISPECIES: class I SAM-dependent methyltransferase [Bradyrhizobium]NPV20017.1 class I SAM-dependent methyltransferase [Bradyrhizobium aeschynomenes]